jgi:hypothetical protein
MKRYVHNLSEIRKRVVLLARRHPSHTAQAHPSTATTQSSRRPGPSTSHPWQSARHRSHWTSASASRRSSCSRLSGSLLTTSGETASAESWRRSRTGCSWGAGAVEEGWRDGAGGVWTGGGVGSLRGESRSETARPSVSIWESDNDRAG